MWIIFYVGKHLFIIHKLNDWHLHSRDMLQSKLLTFWLFFWGCGFEKLEAYEDLYIKQHAKMGPVYCWIGHANKEHPTVHCILEFQAYSINKCIIRPEWFWLSTSGNCSSWMHCGNVASMLMNWIKKSILACNEDTYPCLEWKYSETKSDNSCDASSHKNSVCVITWCHSSQKHRLKHRL